FDVLTAGQKAVWLLICRRTVVIPGIEILGPTWETRTAPMLVVGAREFAPRQPRAVNGTETGRCGAVLPRCDQLARILDIGQRHSCAAFRPNRKTGADRIPLVQAVLRGVLGRTIPAAIGTFIDYGHLRERDCRRHPDPAQRAGFPDSV